MERFAGNQITKRDFRKLMVERLKKEEFSDKQSLKDYGTLEMFFKKLTDYLLDIHLSNNNEKAKERCRILLELTADNAIKSVLGEEIIDKLKRVTI